ncbi:redoxin domain-containing protein [Micromonospora musae]|uniref:TlpA family protein disulfide reductase n=1 Tax=Micromonospora musae TaxID=1894970 RepID=UPI00342D596A
MSEAAVAVVGVIACLNLLISYGIIRRLREYDTRLAAVGGGGGLPPAQPLVGSRVPAFEATTIDGSAITDRDLVDGGVAVVGFFSTKCPPCREQLPRFVELVARRGYSSAITVVIDDSDDPADRLAAVEQSRHVSMVVVEAPGGAMAGAFGADRWPTMIAIKGRVVSANTHTAVELPQLTSA